MNAKELIDKIAKDLPGSIGAAQVGQVVKRALDEIAMWNHWDRESFFARRKKTILKRKSKTNTGSANCVLPRAAKK